MTRQQANREILKNLSALVEAYPNLRFHQLLTNADVLMTHRDVDCTIRVHDEYYLESEALLKRLYASDIWKAK